MSLSHASPRSCKSDDEFFTSDLRTDDVTASDDDILLAQCSSSLPSTEEYDEHKACENQVQETAGYRPTKDTDDNSLVPCPSAIVDELGTDELGDDELGTDELGTNDLGADKLATDDMGAEELGTDELGTDELGTDELGDDEFGTDELGTVELGTDKLGTGDMGADELDTDELGTDELGTDELGTDEQGVDGSKLETQAVNGLGVGDPMPVTQAVTAEVGVEGSPFPFGEAVDEVAKEKEDDALSNLEVLGDDDDDDSDTLTETIDNLEAFEIDDDDDIDETGKAPLGVTAPSPPPPAASPSTSSTASSSSSSTSTSSLSSSATASDLCTVSPEDLKCDTPSCRHLAHSRAGLVLHLSTHYEFEVKSSTKSGETKFSYINGKYLCSLCPMTTLSRTVFGEHVRHHLLTHPYKCGHCSEGVDSIVQLRQHNRSAHRQLLVKLVINESGRVDGVMSKLGPQAPPTGTDCQPPPLTGRAAAAAAATERRPSCDSAKEPICIDDDGDDESSDARSSCGTKTAAAPGPLPPLRKEPLSQNFKYSLTKDGRLLCAQCRYMTAEVEAFANHVFNDIHQALNNPCGKCNQRGKRTDASHDCIIVDQITRALLRQKELQGVPKESQEAGQRGGSKVIGPAARKDTDQMHTTERRPCPIREKERPAAEATCNQTLPKSPFEETMALLRTLSSDNQSDAGLFSPEDKATQEVKKEPAPELETSDSGVARSATTADVYSYKGSSKVSKDPKDRELPTARRLGESSRDLTGTNSLTAKKETLLIKNESISSEEKLATDTDILKDERDLGCCRCLAYKATPRERLSLEELDLRLKDLMDSESASDAGVSTSYRCGIPGCMFTSSLDLNFKLHCMVKHPGMAALTCSLCQRGFDDEDLLLDHINCEHNQGLGSPVDKGIYLCSVENCGVSFNRVVELKAHFVTGHPHLGSFPCSFCFECLPTLDGIMVHIQTHLINVMKCSYCKKVFNDKDELLAHISTSHEGQPKKINICIKIVNNSRLKTVAEGKSKEDLTSPIENLASPVRINTTEKSEERHATKIFSGEEVDRKDTIEALHTDRNRSVQSPAQQTLDADVELVEAKESLAVKCEQCSFTCNTDIQLKVHVYECHTKDRAAGLAFTCKSCNMATNVKETLQKHVAHHTGKTVVRFYVCPYCSKQSSLMDLIEDHVMNDHPNEPFKFEVIQDMIAYLQDMMLCPICRGGFTWKQDLLHHLGSVHRLEDLVSYLDSTFPEKPFLRSCRIPRHLFKDLIPASVRGRSPERRKDDVIVRDAYLKRQNESSGEKSADSGRDGMILRFHCEICEFSINDYPKYREHMASHGNILDDVQNFGINRLSPLPTSAGEIVFGGGSGDLYGTVSEPQPPRRKRMKLTCSLCPFECNKTLNYRRHMAIHERNKFMTDGFKCGYCQFLHDRQNCIKFHLGKYHGHLPPKICRIVGGREVDVGPDDDLMRPSRNTAAAAAAASAAAALQSASPAVDLSREKRTQKQTNRWSASWESPYSFTGRSRRMMREHRRLVNRPMENIAADYMESDLPAGMIYPEPIKCPKCQFSNRVRINLVRHMKLHQNDGDIGLVDEPDVLPFDANVSGSANDDRCATTSSIATEKDCIKIEADDGNFNASLSGRNSPLNDSARCPSAARSASDAWPAASDSHGSDVDLNDGQTQGGSGGLDGGEPGASTKKLFKCCYCSIVSKWNRRDISLHILHVHMQKRVYACQYCSYGSSKSSAIVMNHCSKIHPQKQIFVRDELALFNAIMPVQEDSSLVTVGFLKPDGVPILDLVELRRHLGLSTSGLQEAANESVAAEKRPSRASSSSGSLQKKSRPNDDRDQPLDLSVKIRGATDPIINKEPEGSGGFTDAEFAGANSGVEFAEWKCKLCKFRNRSANHVKRHILCHHMRLKPFSCPYCHLYQWKAQAVASHIDKFHPGQPKTPVSTANEKVSYLSRNMTRVFVRPGVGPEEQCEPRGSGPSSSSASDQSRFTGVCSTSFYRCRQCGFQEVRHDKTKYHVIKQHLKLGLFSCPYCRKYMWGRNYVARHIRSTHPGQEIRIQRTFDEYANYLRDNIKKIGGSTVETTRSRFPPVRRDLFRDSQIGSPTMNSSSNDTAGTTSDRDRRQNPLGSVTSSSLKKPHRYYKCFYCSFQHSLAARVQSHCLSKHPTRPVKYRETAPGVEEWRVPARQIKVELTDEENEGETQTNPLPAGGGNDLSLQGQDDSPGQVARPSPPIEMYMCHYCHHLLWNMEEMMAHLCESHPDDPPEFELMQEPATASSPPMNTSASTSSLGKIPKNATRIASSKVPDGQVEKAIEPRHAMNEVRDEDVDDDSAHHAKKPTRNFREDDFLFKCRLCSYHTDKVTVMRHHVMSHLLYHPYRCPYCVHAHSVKSSPITKHIKLKHPGMDPQFSCARDEEMERQVRSTYYRTVRDGTESTVPVKSFRKLLAIPLTPKMRKPSRRAFYKCKYCGLVTHIRTDMKHHLMREIHYKPFVCGYCNYTEPSRSGMGKHFRSKHCGMVVDIRCTHDAQEDARVEQMLEECVTRHDPDSVIDSCSSSPPPPPQTNATSAVTRRNEPFKLLTKKVPAPTSETTSVHGGSGLNPAFGSSSSFSYTGSRFAVFPGYFGSHSKVQKSFMSSRAPKIHRCLQCSYSSTSLRPLQAHMVKHRPCRLQCGYCTHRSHYPSWIRKHIRSSHPGLAFKYCKVPSSGPKAQAAEVKQETGFDSSLALSVARIQSPSPPPPPPPPLPTPTPPLVSKSVAAFSSIGKKPQKQQQAPALLDGVELDIALVPGRDGYYRCPQCDYQTANRSHYKMHSVIHKPRKWKCFYCCHKFPLIFRLRRHCSLKHPRLPVKWVDVATEQVCDDSTRLHSFRHHQSPSASSTARKSFQHVVPRLKVAMFRPRRSSSPILSAAGLSNDELTIDLDLESSGSPVTSADLDSPLSSSSPSSGSVLWFCCPHCPKKYALLPSFVDHLKGVHTPAGSFPVLEILPPMGEGELTLQRCGFCPYESFFKEDFDAHVSAVHTSLRPRRCGHCQFASFVQVDIERHSMESHPNLPVEFHDLDQPYTMNSNDEIIPDDRALYNFDPTVKLVDVCKILQDKWESV